MYYCLRLVFHRWVKFFSRCFGKDFFFIWETKKWSLVVLDRWSSYTVMIECKFAWVDLKSGRLIEVVIWTGLTVPEILTVSASEILITNLPLTGSQFLCWRSFKVHTKIETLVITIFGIFYDLLLNATTQPLGTHYIWHCVLTVLIRETLDFLSLLFLVFIACKHEKLFKKWDNLVLYWIWSSFHVFLSLQPQ